jgi:fucokinase
LYADFLYVLASDSTLESFYKEAPEGEMCPELLNARKLVWDALRPYSMKLLRLAPAKFVHFGTTKEIMELMNKGVESYKELNWTKHVCSSITKEIPAYNSVLSDKATIGDNCYLEVSYVSF